MLSLKPILGSFDLLDVLPDIDSRPIPRISLSGNTQGVAPFSVAVDSSASTATTGIDSRVWDFGDGTIRSGVQASHTYVRPGTYEIRLTLTASDGETASERLTIVVTDVINEAPQAVLSAASVVGRTVRLEALGSSDPNGDALTYEIDFGDGSPVGTNGVEVHEYPADGNYTATLTVSDGILTDTAILNITVSEPAGVDELDTVRERFVAQAQDIGSGQQINVDNAIAQQRSDGTFQELGTVPTNRPSQGYNNYMMNWADAISHLARQYAFGSHQGDSTLLMTILRSLKGYIDYLPDFVGSKPLGWPQKGIWAPRWLGYTFCLLKTQIDTDIDVDGMGSIAIRTAIYNDFRTNSYGTLWTRSLMTDSDANNNGSNRITRSVSEGAMVAGCGTHAEMLDLLAYISVTYFAGAGFGRQGTGVSFWNGFTSGGGISAHTSDGHHTNVKYSAAILNNSAKWVEVTRSTAYALSAQTWQYISTAIAFVRWHSFRTRYAPQANERDMFSWIKPSALIYYIQNLMGLVTVGQEVDQATYDAWSVTEQELRRIRMPATQEGSFADWVTGDSIVKEAGDAPYCIHSVQGSHRVGGINGPIFGGQSHQWHWGAGAGARVTLTSQADYSGTDENEGDQFEAAKASYDYQGPTGTVVQDTDAGVPLTAQTGTTDSNNTILGVINGADFLVKTYRKDRDQDVSNETYSKTEFWVRGAGSNPSYYVDLVANLNYNGGPAPANVMGNFQEIWRGDVSRNLGQGAGVEVLDTAQTDTYNGLTNPWWWNNGIGVIWRGTGNFLEKLFSRTRNLRDVHTDYGTSSGSQTASILRVAQDFGNNPSGASMHLEQVMKATPAQMDTIRDAPAYSVLYNEAAKQFIQVGANTVMGAFHQADSIDVWGITISVTGPCVLRIVDNGDGTYGVSFADAEWVVTETPKSINITIGALAATALNFPGFTNQFRNGDGSLSTVTSYGGGMSTITIS